jgi:hypothetical protein
VCGQHHAPASFTSGKDPVPIVQEAGWTPEPVWIGAENLGPPAFDPRTFQPVASRYTDYAISAPRGIYGGLNFPLLGEMSQNVLTPAHTLSVLVILLLFSCFIRFEWYLYLMDDEPFWN